MAGNEDKAVFSKRTCCPTLMTFCSEPLVGWFMMSMHRIRQGKKQVDVEKKDFEDKTGHSLLGCGLDSSLKMNEHFAPAAKPPPLKKPGAEAPGFFNLGI